MTKPITVTLENSGLDLTKHGFKGTPEEHRRVEHEIGVVLELISQMNTLLISRRGSPNPYLGMAIGTVQCAVLRHFIDQVDSKGYGEFQGMFDAVVAMLGGAKNVADATQTVIDAQAADKASREAS